MSASAAMLNFCSLAVKAKMETTVYHQWLLKAKLTDFILAELCRSVALKCLVDLPPIIVPP